MNSPITRAWLVEIYNNQRTYELKQQTSIGRDVENDIILPQLTISRFHASIVYRDGQYLLIDQGANATTLLNNYRVRHHAILHNNDVITLGDVYLKFVSSN